MQKLFIICSLVIIILSSCSSFLSEQEYIKANEGMQIKRVWSGILFTLPEERNIYKIVIVGDGKVKNIEVQARVHSGEWETIKNIKKMIELPYKIRTMVQADAFRILQKTMTGRGKIETIELYSLKSTP